MKIKKHILALAWTVSSIVYSNSALSDQLVIDDLIVTGSTCVGVDCIDGEEFGYDTLKLKANDPLIMFDDTSATGGFPSNDWSIGITDYGLGGTADFVIKDVTGNTNVLLMQAGPWGGITLGAGSTVEENAISVGATAMERRIMHVAPGVEPTDAINLSQIPALVSPINDRIDALNVRIDDLLNRINSL
ncbi:MAG: hypothetical protein OEY11_10820 [Gammaproteobacteria bacterium]|nr:hypothetical protein [Gammaproteobacteria bacterium]